MDIEELQGLLNSGATFSSQQLLEIALAKARCDEAKARSDEANSNARIAEIKYLTECTSEDKRSYLNSKNGINSGIKLTYLNKFN